MGGTEGANAVTGLVNPVTSAVDEKFKISERMKSLVDEDTAEVRKLRKERAELDKQIALEERNERKAKLAAATKPVEQGEEQQEKSAPRKADGKSLQTVAMPREADSQKRDEATESLSEPLAPSATTPTNAAPKSSVPEAPGSSALDATAQAAEASAEAAEASAEAAEASAQAAKTSAQAAKDAGDKPPTTPPTTPAKKPTDDNGNF
jgi:hypothetical protein